MLSFIKHNSVHIGGILGILGGLYGLATGTIPQQDAVTAIISGVTAITIGLKSDANAAKTQAVVKNQQ